MIVLPIEWNMVDKYRKGKEAMAYVYVPVKDLRKVCKVYVRDNMARIKVKK